MEGRCTASPARTAPRTSVNPARGILIGTFVGLTLWMLVLIVLHSFG